jgi:hypothetical protein
LAGREIPADVAVAEFPLLQAYTEPVAEEVQTGRSARKSRMDDLNCVDWNLLPQLFKRVVTGTAAEHQKDHESAGRADDPSSASDAT